MSFVYPILLGGLGLLAVPILIHLIFRQKPRRLRFPAFRFLAQRSRTNQRKLQLRHLLLLVMRMLLLALICFALARPKVSGDVISLQTDRPVAIILLFDTSYSMQYKTTDGKNRLDEAREQAFALLQTLHPDSEVIVLNTAEPPGAKVEWLKRYKALAQIQSLALSYENHPITTRLADAYQLFTRLAVAADNDIGPRLPRVLCVFSDRMEACWDKSHLPRLAALADAVPTPLEALHALQGGIPGKIALLKELRSQLNPPASQDFPEQALIAHWEELHQKIPTAKGDNYPSPEFSKLIAQTRSLSRDLSKRISTLEAPAEQSKKDFRQKILDSLEAGLRELQGVNTLFVDVGLDDATDLAITAVDFVTPDKGPDARQAFSPKDKFQVRATVHASGATFNSTLLCKLIGKEDKQTRTIENLESGESKEFLFDLGTLQPDFYQVQLELSAPDRLDFTDRRFATFQIRAPRKILIITDEPKTADLFKKAIQFNEKVAFDCTVLGSGEKSQDIQKLGPSDLNKYSAVYLMNVADPPESLWKSLKTYVQNGGNVGVIPAGDTLVKSAYNSAAAKELLPAELTGTISDEAGAVWDWNDEAMYRHPFLKAFGHWRLIGRDDFIKVPRKAYRFWQVKPYEKKSSVLVYYAAKKGSEKREPALLERDFGKDRGRVLLLTTRLDSHAEPFLWNNYLKFDGYWVVVLPGELSIYLAGELEQHNLNFTIGQSLPRLTIPPNVVDLSFSLNGPIPPDPITRPEKSNELVLRKAVVPGNYRLDGKAPAPVGKFSVNIPKEEGSLQRVPLTEIEPLLGKDAVRMWKPGDSLPKVFEGVWSTPEELLPVALVALVVLLALENMLANLFYRREPKVQEAGEQSMIFANTSLVFDPVWPWSLPFLGWPVLVLVALLLAGLTVLTYLVGPRANVKHFFIVLFLRLAALFIAFVLMLRPAMAQREEGVVPSKLLFLIDSSTSMNNKDEFNSQSRWARAYQLLFKSSAVKQALDRLRDQQKMEILFYQGAEDVKEYDPNGQADGKRTDMGQWLVTIKKLHESDNNVRGLILLSDGADNGTAFPTLDMAKGMPFPIFTFGLGSSKTTADEKDIYFVPDSIVASPSPVPTKGKLTVKAVINAPGFSNVVTTARVFINDKEVDKKNIVLPFRPNKSDGKVVLELSKDNKFEVEIDAPAEPGDYKVTLKVDPVKGELSELNNEISTYVTVTKDGISVLWVEGRKRLESTWVIRHVLSHDPKVRVFYTERVKEKQALPAGQKDWFLFEKQHYDVIVIGDISASRFAGGDPDVFGQLKNLVKKGSGLLMLGGYDSLGNGDWNKHPEFTDILPVKLDSPGQLEGVAVKVTPTVEGLEHYVMKLSQDAKENERIWSTIFKPLDGMTKIGTVRPEAVALASDNGDKNKPVMAFKNFGGGRVVVFGGDTTWKSWRRSKEAVAAYGKFWKRLVYWLAKKDKVGEDVWVKLDTRRLPAGGNHKIGMIVGLNPDKSKKYGNVNYKVRVVGPNQKETIVSTWPQGNSENFEQGGSFWETNAPGEYIVKVDAFDASGKKINEATTEARFLTYAQDLENLRPAADHAFLAQLAAASGGQFRLASEGELVELLNSLGQKAALLNQSQKVVWPDWNRDPLSTAPSDQVSALISSGIIFCYLLFCGLLCTEWLLRRRWNMV